ncbi:hypothetical protein GWI33_006340 [Rhynchophorus ferrugineus]|uniref:Uncharacterized protein n=1 Tax=Rhynchophorus ferrugineus TaxID=354439 RepID=A0A834IG91_RHYFE|nr:hypothetical protein GWI33_006340 [Rhynchophorus ferrugineus]
MSETTKSNAEQTEATILPFFFQPRSLIADYNQDIRGSARTEDRDGDSRADSRAKLSINLERIDKTIHRRALLETVRVESFEMIIAGIGRERQSRCRAWPRPPSSHVSIGTFAPHLNGRVSSNEKREPIGPRPRRGYAFGGGAERWLRFYRGHSQRTDARIRPVYYSIKD